MASVVVHVAAALICVGSQCEPALVGKPQTPTPTGTFQMYRALTSHPHEYTQGPDSYAFAAAPDGRHFTIHRTWQCSPGQNRNWRITRGTELDRHISDGCINVQPSVFEKIKGLCGDRGCTVEIKP